METIEIKDLPEGNISEGGHVLQITSTDEAKKMPITEGGGAWDIGSVETQIGVLDGMRWLRSFNVVYFRIQGSYANITKQIIFNLPVPIVSPYAFFFYQIIDRFSASFGEIGSKTSFVISGLSGSNFDICGWYVQNENL